MSNQIYRKKEYIIIRVSNGYLVMNTHKAFNEGHTHIKNFKACQKVIHWSLHKEVPIHVSDYILTSLIRISEDEEYINKLTESINTIRSIKDNKPKYRRN